MHACQYGKAVLDAIEETQDLRTRWLLIDALRLSPGDKKWLRQASVAIIAVQHRSPTDSGRIKGAIKWLDSRINSSEPES